MGERNALLEDDGGQRLGVVRVKDCVGEVGQAQKRVSAFDVPPSMPGRSRSSTSAFSAGSWTQAASLICH